MTITPQEFVNLWARAEVREQQGAQSHFNMLCDLVGHKLPIEEDPEGISFAFEKHLTKATGGKGRADVWKQGNFAWEYKGKDKDLNAAYAQLLAYRGDLGNPPLLVVCDFLTYKIYPQWVNMSGLPFEFTNADLLFPWARNYIKWLLEDPDKFKEVREDELRERERLTLRLAHKFAELADGMRRFQGSQWDDMRIARFLTKLVFALFAEDIDLIPPIARDMGIFRYLTEGAQQAPGQFVYALTELFEAMNGQKSAFMVTPIPYFNGSIFAPSAPDLDDGVEVLDLTLIPGAVQLLQEAAAADWRMINPTIFGTLFEGALNPSKRAQLGAHYTSEADIRLIVEPVLMEPLSRAWEQIRSQAEPHLQTFLVTETPRPRQDALDTLIHLHDEMMSILDQMTVLDPACGSGNFLYVGLRAMKDLERQVREFFEPIGLPFRDVVTPRQFFGIEKDAFAAKLAHVVIWIGYLQWRYEDEGGELHTYKKTSRPHPRQLPNPILKDKNEPSEPDRIQWTDAILRYDENGQPYEPDWQPADVIIGNPPFLGGSRMRSELGEQYLEDLWQTYTERIPGFSDLVCYWWEKARAHIETGKAKRAGLIATNSIRGGVNRTVLERIKETGDIFMAWSDNPWLLEGAAVRISIAGFDDGTEKKKLLDGNSVTVINPDLTSSINVTEAHTIKDNANISFRGTQKGGAFDIDETTAKKLLQAVNPSGLSNSDVVKPWVNGTALVGNPTANTWIIDFGTSRNEEDAKRYAAPYQYVSEHVYPVKSQNRRAARAEHWWLHSEVAVGMREALKGLSRYIATPRVSKYRLFVWIAMGTLADDGTYVFARDDDYFFGVLHSYVHEIWSLRLGTWLGKGNDPRYTPSTTFETFPFPWSPGREPVVPSPQTPLPHEERGLTDSPARHLWERGSGGEGQNWDRWEISPELDRKMTEVARDFRKNPTPSEAILWEALRDRGLEGRKFRRQMPIGPFVVDFYCASERLVVEVDGLIHKSQQEADTARQSLIESLGIRFVRVAAAQVEQNLDAVLDTIAAAFSPLARSGRGAGGEGLYLAIAAAAKALHEERHVWLNPPELMGEKAGLGAADALKKRTLTNLYNALSNFRSGSPARNKNGDPAVSFAPRLAELHAALDQAVLMAYGWDDLFDEPRTAQGDEELLRRLLELNRDRAG